MPESNPLQFGQKFGYGRFVLFRFLGRGGMGEVWLAQDEQLREPVALKFLPPEIRGDPAALDDLRRETARSHQLSHPNIVRIHDLHKEQDGTAFIVMEYVDGLTLAALRLRQANRVMSWHVLQPSVEQLCAALDYAHSEKIIHRDLKPANLMVDGKGRLKLADFGVAAVVSDSMSRISVKHTTSGTLPYMSPQQVAGKRPHPTDDIYALGATLYELLTSKMPFHGGDLTHQILHELPEPMEERLAVLEIQNEIPPNVSALIMACLAKEPGQRPQSARDVVEWIGPAVPQKPSIERFAQNSVNPPIVEQTVPQPNELDVVGTEKTADSTKPFFSFLRLLPALLAAIGIVWFWWSVVRPSLAVAHTPSLSPFVVFILLLLAILVVYAFWSAFRAPAKITILWKPKNRVVAEGEVVELHVAAKARVSLRYQWLKNDEPIPGATSSTLMVAGSTRALTHGYHQSVVGVSLADTGRYTVVVAAKTAKNVAAAYASAHLTVTPESSARQKPSVERFAQPIMSEPVIEQAVPPPDEPESETVGTEEMADSSDPFFTVLRALGLLAVIGLIWYFGSNVWRSKTKQDEITILSKPEGKVVAEGASVEMQVTANAREPLSYQWFRGGEPLPGATSPTLIVSDFSRTPLPGIGKVSLADAGLYTVVITAKNGATAYATAQLTVTQAASAVNHSTNIIQSEPTAVPPAHKFDQERTFAANAVPFTGRVLRPDGQPAPNAIVRICDWDVMRTDRQGRFQFPRVNPGRFVVRGEAPGGEYQKTLSFVGNQALRMDLPLKAVTTVGIRWALQQQEGSRELAGEGVRMGEAYFSVRHSRFLLARGAEVPEMWGSDFCLKGGSQSVSSALNEQQVAALYEPYSIKPVFWLFDSNGHNGLHEENTRFEDIRVVNGGNPYDEKTYFKYLQGEPVRKGQVFTLHCVRKDCYAKMEISDVTIVGKH